MIVRSNQGLILARRLFILNFVKKISEKYFDGIININKNIVPLMYIKVVFFQNSN